MSSVRQAPASERADGRRNKQLILDAAWNALAQNPQTSIGEIAERAGLTRATVYRHYPDRDELVRAVAAEGAAHLIPALLDALRPLAWSDALDLLASQAVRLGAEYRDLILLMAPRLQESARDAVAGEPIAVEVAARRASGEITSPLTDAWLALCIRTLCLAAVSRLTDPEVDLDETAAQLSLSLRNLCA